MPQFLGGKIHLLSLRERRIYKVSLWSRVFAVSCPLALRHSALYPISVRRPAVSRSAPSSDSPEILALRFARVVATNSPEDLHPLADDHTGQQDAQNGNA
jgi:hypothetical protein